MMTLAAPAANPAPLPGPVGPSAARCPKCGSNGAATDPGGGIACADCGYLKLTLTPAAHPALALVGPALIGPPCTTCGAPVYPAGGGLMCAAGHVN